LNTFSRTATLPFPADFLLSITSSNHNIPLRQRRSSNCALRPRAAQAAPSIVAGRVPFAPPCRPFHRDTTHPLLDDWPKSCDPRGCRQQSSAALPGDQPKSRGAARWTRVAIGAYEFQLSLCTVVSSVPPASLAPPPQLSYRVLSTGPCSRQIIPLPTSPFPLRLDHHYYTRYSHPPNSYLGHHT